MLEAALHKAFMLKAYTVPGFCSWFGASFRFLFWSCLVGIFFMCSICFLNEFLLFASVRMCVWQRSEKRTVPFCSVFFGSARLWRALETSQGAIDAFQRQLLLQSVRHRAQCSAWLDTGSYGTLGGAAQPAPGQPSAELNCWAPTRVCCSMAPPKWQ